MSRAVLVTGAGTGIGRAVAESFVTDGDKVWITGRRAALLAATAASFGPSATAVPCDHTDPARIRDLVEQLPGRVDVLVNCAGGNTDFDRPAPSTLDELADAWRANIDANLLSAVLTTHAVRDRLGRGSRLVHVGSIAADKGAGSYGAAKAGLASWNVDLATELGPLGITSNVVAPGYVADTEFFRDRLTEGRRADLVTAARTRRASTPADVAAVVHFLAGDAACQITAQTIAVNGGEHPTR